MGGRKESKKLTGKEKAKRKADKRALKAKNNSSMEIKRKRTDKKILNPKKKGRAVKKKNKHSR